MIRVNGSQELSPSQRDLEGTLQMVGSLLRIAGTMNTAATYGAIYIHSNLTR